MGHSLQTPALYTPGILSMWWKNSTILKDQEHTYKNGTKSVPYSWKYWHTPVIPATQKAKVGE